MKDAHTFPTIGILGGGQLGRMLALAGIRMGLKIRFLNPEPSGPMEGLGEHMIGDWNEAGVLRSFAEQCDVLTVESEWAPADRLALVLPEGAALWPSPETLHVIRHKGRQKQRLVEARLPVPDFRLCATPEDALQAASDFGFPVVLKKYRGSYDGYGNATADSEAEVLLAWNALANRDGLLVETRVPFVRELAVLIARSPGGQCVTYPVAHTIQLEHRCHTVVVPADVPRTVIEEAERVSLGAVEAVGGVGITAVELFEREDGRILINELAPRPHNTGHYSIEGCHTSQFENHLRGILGWPLGSTALREPVAVMVNVLGTRDGPARPEGLTEALAVKGVAVHLYGKREARRKRKLGHVTTTGSDRADTIERAQRAARMILL